MLVATRDLILPTTITGSLPRPVWFDRELQGRTFSLAWSGDAVYREQYGDAMCALMGDQLRAGLDIFTDGDMRFDRDIGGRAWFGYLFERMAGMSDVAVRSLPFSGDHDAKVPRRQTPGDLMHDLMESRLPPLVTGPVSEGRLEYDRVWKAAQRFTERPVKLGACCGQMVEKQVINQYYDNRLDSVMAFSRALNAEYHRLADAGCPIIQVEEPCLHLVAGGEWDVSPEQYVEAFNIEVAGLRDRTEVWCHTCWGNPMAQKVEAQYSYKPVLPYLDQLDVDVITFETAENGGAELAEIAAAVSADKKICIGVVSHRSLQIELPETVADLIRRALRHIAVERLVLSTDCGFGRQGMGRAHAFYKMLAITRGANIVRAELGLPEVPIMAMDPRFALIART